MAESKSAPKDLPFAGYENLQSNYVYTPNQFFDVVVPHSDRGTLRIVGYLIRRQLGYITPEGEIQEPIIGVSHRELVSKAKVSSGALAPALRKAIDLNFIEEIRPGRAHSRGEKGETAHYALKWDKSADHYEKAIEKFQGFYAKDANRTPIPNQFFDVTLRNEPFSVSSVVGMVIRWSVGFKTEFGHRRTQTALSASRIAELAQMGTTITKKAVRDSISKGYIICVKKGVFDPKAVVRKASVYQVRWADGDGNASKSDPANRNLNTGSDFETPQKVTQRDASKSDPETPQKVTLENASKSDPNKRNLINNTSKQQQGAADVDEVFEEKFSLLQEVGFDVKAAFALAESADLEVIKNQIEWIDRRNATSNKLGMLRKAIQEDWDEPQTGAISGDGPDFIQAFQAAYDGTQDHWLSPSPLETKVAAEFSEKLCRDLGGDTKSWGEKFGKYVKRELGNRHRSFEKTVRFQASKFLAIERSRISDKTRTERERAEDEKLRQQDEQHKEWLAYVESQVSEIQELRPDEVAEFENARSQEREVIANDPEQGGLFLVMFDRRDSYLEAFAGKFSEDVLSEDKFTMSVK